MSVYNMETSNIMNTLLVIFTFLSQLTYKANTSAVASVTEENCMVYLENKYARQEKVCKCPEPCL